VLGRGDAARFAARSRSRESSAATRVRNTGWLTRGLTALALVGWSSACHVVDSKDWNLRQLHDAQGHHQYNCALEGDFQFFLRQRIAAPLLSAGSTLAVKTPERIDDPAGECLDNLVDLEDFDASDPRVAGLQVEWFSRLSIEDPWKLSRERAVLALGRAGRRLDAGLPVGLPPGALPAGPEALSSALAALLKSARPVIEKGHYAGELAEIDLNAACEVIENMTLDIEGGRRALRVTVDLARAAGLNNTAMEPVWRLSANLQRECVRLGLAAGLLDREPIVRGAAIEASVTCAGTRILIPILAQIAREPSSEVLVRVLRLVRDAGLPEAPAGTTPAEAQHMRETWIGAIYGLLQTRPEGEVRVSAMLALAAVSGAGLHTLREEDWQAWWVAHQPPSAERPAPSRSGPNAADGLDP
jgi:hypothetical protein